MTKVSNYIFSADLLRSLAIILVVLIHVFSEFLNYQPALGSITWWIADFMNAGARIAVPLFIMLSGMLLLHTDKKYSLSQFLKKRAGKIGAPIIIWPIIYLLWKLLYASNPLNSYSIIRDFINLNIYYHLYYLYIIAALYLLTPLIKTILTTASKELKTYFFWLSVLFSLTLTAAVYFLQIGINLSTIFTVFIPFISYYLAGDYFRHKKITRKELSFYSIAFILLMSITALGTRWHMAYLQDIKMGKQIVDYGKYFYDYTSITVALMSYIAFVVLHNLNDNVTSLKEKKIGNGIVSLAGASFGIYLIHPLFLAMSNKYLGTGFDQSQIPQLVIVFTKLVGLLTLSYLTVILFKRIPLLKSIV